MWRDAETNDSTSQGKALEEVPAIHPLPWFGTVEGFALVPPEGALVADEDPAAIVVLTEGGQLMVHDLSSFTPVPLNLPFQVMLCQPPAQDSVCVHCGGRLVGGRWTA